MRNFEKVKRLENEDIKLPERSTKHSAGYDFFAIEDVTIEPSKYTKLVLNLEGTLIAILIILLATVELVIGSWRLTLYALILLSIIKTACTKISSRKPTLVKTGVKVKMEDDEVLLLVNRSSNPSKKNLVMANDVGVIDADYYGNPDNDGEMAFAFYNVGSEPITIHKGDKLGQGIFVKYLTTDDDTADGERTGGFGSTGK